MRVGIHYTFSDGIGVGQVTYCFEVTQEFLLTNGLIVTSEKVEVGMEFLLEGGMVATVTGVEQPKAYPPPPAGKDAYGNSVKRVVGTVRYSGHYPVLDLVVGDRPMTTTPGHWFYSLDRGCWVDADTLVVGEWVETEDRVPAPVASVSRPRFERIDLHNAEIEDFHTYFVGTSSQNSVWSHNGLEGGCAIPKPAKGRVGLHDQAFHNGYEAIFGNGNAAVRQTLAQRLPKTRGSWVEGTPGNGVWRSTDIRVRRAAASPGGPIPDYVDVRFQNNYPVFNKFVKDVHGIRGQTRITLDTDAKASLRTRTDRDFSAANTWMAEQLNKAKVAAPGGGEWTVGAVKDYLKSKKWQWHHHEDMTTMQLMPEVINDKIAHIGGRSLMDFSFTPPLPKRTPH